MRTDELISKLAEDLKPVKRAAPAPLLALRGLALSAAATLAMMMLFHWRRDLSEAAAAGPFLPSTIGFAASAGLFAFAACAAAVPGRKGQARALALAAAALAGTAAFVGAFPFRAGLGQDGAGSWECARAVALFSVAPAAILIFGLRSLAPERPWVAGASAGLAAAALGAAGLAFICPNDHPLHLLAWHLAVPATAVAALASALGSRLLKW